MTIHIDSNTLIILACVATILITTLIITTSILIHIVRGMRHQIMYQNRILYSVWKDTRQSKYMVDHTLDQIELIETNVSTLASELDIHIQKEQEERDRKIYPMPELAKQIEATIQEQFAIQLILRRNMRAPIKGALNDISDVVQKTYPHVDVEYIASKCIAFMESQLSESESDESS